MKQLRTRIVNIRLTPAEHTELLAAAGTTVSDYIRHILIEHMRYGSRIDALDSRVRALESARSLDVRWPPAPSPAAVDPQRTLAALERAATPGPWRDCDCKCGQVMQPGGEAIIRQFHREEEVMLADAALIAAARNALPELLAHIEELEQMREALICKLRDIDVRKQKEAE